MSESILGDWVIFVFLSAYPNMALASEDVSPAVYQIERFIERCGEPIVLAPPARWILQMESLNRAALGEATQTLGSQCGRPLIGVTQHLHYTTAAQQADLLRVSAQPVDAAGAVAVLIPIAKSDVWWELPHDEQQRHFLRTERTEGRTAIGHRYADRIYRKLYRSRYIHPPQGFDFLTYFEFPEDLAEDFRALLSNLRHPQLNPEWASVRREVEIWLRK
jgi:hypothetical protein